MCIESVADLFGGFCPFNIFLAAIDHCHFLLLRQVCFGLAELPGWGQKPHHNGDCVCKYVDVCMGWVFVCLFACFCPLHIFFGVDEWLASLVANLTQATHRAKTKPTRPQHYHPLTKTNAPCPHTSSIKNATPPNQSKKNGTPPKTKFAPQNHLTQTQTHPAQAQI